MLDLRFHVLPGKFIPIGFEQEYIKAYELFRSNWSETFQEIFGSNFILYSNDFTRQDYIQAIFLEEKCIAVDCVREINLKNPADLDDSWFKPWKRSYLKRFIRKGYKRCLVNSYFTVHKDYRKSVVHDKYSISYVMGCLSVLYQIELGSSLMFGMMRNDRSMHSLGTMWGSQTIESNIMYNSAPTDLVVFTKENVRKAATKFPDFVFDIFNLKRDYYSPGARHARSA